MCSPCCKFASISSKQCRRGAGIPNTSKSNWYVIRITFSMFEASLMLTLIILMNSWYSLLYILNFPLADDCPMAYSCFVIEQNLHLVMESLDGVYGLLDFLITFCFIFLVALEVRRQFFCSTMLIMFYSFAQSLLNIFLIDFLLV